MTNEFLDKASGRTQESKIRVELNGIHQIQQYCETNSLKNLSAEFTRKNKAIVGGNQVFPVDINDFNLRASFQTEKKISSHGALAESIISTWREKKKTFRYLNRTSFIHKDLPIRFDLSIVKESESEEIEFRGRKQYKLRPEYTVQ